MKKEWRLPKPINNHPGYDMDDYYRTYLGNYFSTTDFEKFLDNEKEYNKLSIIKKLESSMQWGLRVRIALQDLLSQNKFSIYH